MLKDNVGQKFKPMDLKLKGNGYVGWFTEQVGGKESVDGLTFMSPLEDDEEGFVYIEPVPLREGDGEEGKERKALEILTPNKLLTRLPILLVQIKAGNISYKLKTEIRQIAYLLY